MEGIALAKAEGRCRVEARREMKDESGKDNAFIHRRGHPSSSRPSCRAPTL
jgi:hypothetical protein